MKRELTKKLIVFFTMLTVVITYNNAFALDVPELTVSTFELNVSISWTPVSGSTNYSLYYAPYPYTGENTIGKIDLGTNTSFSATLWDGASYYVVVAASDGTVLGEIGYSNVGIFTISLHPIIPDGAIWETQIIHHEIAPDGFEAVLGWFQVATMSKDQEPSVMATIEVDWVKIVEITADGEQTVVYEENYDSNGPLDYNDGGLFLREPNWFPPGDYHEPITNSKISNGILEINAGATPNRIPHWWTERIIANKNSSYAVEVRVRINGELMFQIGSDYWRTLSCPSDDWDTPPQTSNNCEAWVGDWYGDTDNNYVIIRAPLHR